VGAFDDGTALAPAGDGRWDAHVRESWSNGAGPGINGGLFAALTARAAGEATGLPPRSLTIHYLQPPHVGPVSVSAEVPRQGRTTAFTRLRFAQEEGDVAQAMAVCSAWRPDAPAFADGEPPDWPPLEDCVLVDRSRSGVPPMLSNYEMRVAPFEPADRPLVIGGYVRTDDPRPSDHVALAAMTDAFMPPAFWRPGERVVVPTLELTIHFRGEPPAGEHPWILARFVSRFAAGGVVEEDGELWSEGERSGDERSARGPTLLVQSRQLSVMRRASR
jgi:acyl-coenzyme A thioesterase PaaI-like protein